MTVHVLFFTFSECDVSVHNSTMPESFQRLFLARLFIIAAGPQVHTEGQKFGTAYNLNLCDRKDVDVYENESHCTILRNQ